MDGIKRIQRSKPNEIIDKWQFWIKDREIIKSIPIKNECDFTTENEVIIH